MRVVEPEPWARGMRFRDEPTGLQRYVVAPGSAADGVAIAELPLSESAWVSLVSRRGRLVQVRGTTELQAGDEVLVLMDEETDPAGVFRSPPT
jgi:cell volume regulation protein A